MSRSHFRARFTTILLLACFSLTLFAQDIRDLVVPPKDVVENLWKLAVRGDILDKRKQLNAVGLYKDQDKRFGDWPIVVYSNYYGIVYESVSEKSADFDVVFIDQGKIDSQLRYTPPPPPPSDPCAFETATRYHLEAYPQRNTVSGPNGKTISDKEIPGSKIWKITGPMGQRWATVNAAIRFILEAKQKSHNPVIIKNADETLKKLLTLQ